MESGKNGGYVRIQDPPLPDQSGRYILIANLKFKNMITVDNKTIGEIVAEDYRTAQIFKNHDIDFCCKGNRSIREVCESQNMDADSLLREIEMMQAQKPGETNDYQSWPLDLLADYIEKKHHRYVEERIPVLKTYLRAYRRAALLKARDDANKALAKLDRIEGRSVRA